MFIVFCHYLHCLSKLLRIVGDKTYFVVKCTYNTMKILIIEDEKGLSSSIVAYLQNEQFMCEVAHDMATAMEKTDLYEYACIILDITLPDGNGLEVLKNLKANNKTDGVLIISA